MNNAQNYVLCLCIWIVKIAFKFRSRCVPIFYPLAALRKKNLLLLIHSSIYSSFSFSFASRNELHCFLSLPSLWKMAQCTLINLILISSSKENLRNSRSTPHETTFVSPFYKKERFRKAWSKWFCIFIQKQPSLINIKQQSRMRVFTLFSFTL